MIRLIEKIKNIHWTHTSWNCPDNEQEDRAMMPHCDARVLHAPDTCEYCDHYPDWQYLRDLWGINYTGEHDPNKAECPAESRRPLETIEKWYGNRRKE